MKMQHKNAADVVKTGDTSQIVDFAIEMNRLKTSSEKELELTKTALREVGRSEAALEGSTTAVLKGTLGAATIVFPKDGPAAREKKDLSDLEAKLPAEVFYSLFKKKVTVEFVTDGFEERLAKLTPAQRSVLTEYVQFVPATPRVNLPK